MSKAILFILSICFTSIILSAPTGYNVKLTYAMSDQDRYEDCKHLRAAILTEQGQKYPLKEKINEYCKRMDDKKHKCDEFDSLKASRPTICEASNGENKSSWGACGDDPSITIPRVAGNYTGYFGNYNKGGKKVDPTKTWYVKNTEIPNRYQITWNGKPDWRQDTILMCEKDQNGLVQWYLMGQENTGTNAPAYRGDIVGDIIQWGNNTFWKKK